VGDQVSATLAVIILLVVLVGAVYYIPRFLVGRAVKKVVAIFRKAGATSPQTAKSLDELGLAPKSYAQRMFRTRDYKPYAARLLGQAEIMRATEEGKVYLSEEALANSPQVKKFARMD